MARKRNNFFLGAACLLLGSFLGRLSIPEIGVGCISSTEAVTGRHPVPTKQYAQRGDPNELHVAWLMSFPNSGTTYTLAVVASASLYNVATNYGTELTSGLQPIFPSNDRKGPYWASKDGQTYKTYMNFTLDNPSNGSILTKTHCGGRCLGCHLAIYSISQESFLYACLRYTKEEDHQRPTLMYSMDRVQKAIHLIRDPMDNIVSRFHHERHHHLSEGQLEEFSKTRKGFRTFCRKVVDVFSHKEGFNPPFPLEFWERFSRIPCHTDFFRYVRWHNHAFGVLQDFEIPSMLLHYEDYARDWNATVSGILDFIDQPFRGDKPLMFMKGKTYRDYFSEEEIEDIKWGLHTLASSSTWAQISRYFDS